MASLEELDAATPDVPDVAAATVAQAATVAAASAGGELDPELDADFHVDPAYTSPKQFEEAAKKERRYGIQTLKSAVIISGVVVAVIGAIFAVSKRIKEAR
ncbi:hypothetical protein RHGRI_036741 [Rhododendron griersonianum]|uniref:Uncharacterized protein n=1 Tax=Rhododendron griersonianum TaxID=479676 RepID=A0AAV6HPL3_9ERIC|nr:hypothetical protein RHGRI_036741 [Rhododendron griersonianum]